MRNPGIDGLRIAGIGAVVAGHIGDSDIVRSLIYSWHVPLFFLLSGYLWKPGRSIREEAANRYRTLIRPYISWLSIIGVSFGLISFWCQNLTPADIGKLVLGGAYLGRPFSAFWFVTCLAGSALLFRMLESTPLALKGFIAVIGLTLAYVQPQILNKLPLSLGVAWASLIFMYSGAMLRKVSARVTHPALVGFGLTSVGLFALGLGSQPLDMKYADFGTPILSVVTAVILCSGLLLISEALGGRLKVSSGRAVSTVASVGLLVVLTHASILSLMGTSPNHWWPDFPMALGIPFVVGLVVLRTPAANWLCGTRQVQGPWIQTRLPTD